MSEEHRSTSYAREDLPQPRGKHHIAAAGPQHDTLDDIRRLLDMFKMERLVYLTVTLLSVIVLLTCAIVLLWKRTASVAEIVGLFGSSGGITYSTGRLLRMWSDAIRMLQQQPVTTQ